MFRSPRSTLQCRHRLHVFQLVSVIIILSWTKFASGLKRSACLAFAALNSTVPASSTYLSTFAVIITPSCTIFASEFGCNMCSAFLSFAALNSTAAFSRRAVYHALGRRTGGFFGAAMLLQRHKAILFIRCCSGRNRSRNHSDPNWNTVENTAWPALCNL